MYVYLHGGGFSEGSGAAPVYDGDGLARKGLVVVTVNYRLGVLGFLAHPELTAESPNRASGNYGAPIHEIFAAGDQNDVPTLTGVNADELVGFLGRGGPPTAEAFKEQANQYGSRAEELLELYPADTDEEAATA